MSSEFCLQAFPSPQEGGSGDTRILSNPGAYIKEEISIFSKFYRVYIVGGITSYFRCISSYSLIFSTYFFVLLHIFRIYPHIFLSPIGEGGYADFRLLPLASRNFFQIPSCTPTPSNPQNFSTFFQVPISGGEGDTRILDLPPGSMFKGETVKT